LSKFPAYRARFRRTDPVEKLRAAYYFIALVKEKKKTMCRLIMDFLDSKQLLNKESTRVSGYKGTTKKGLD
jgi:hypothetical protein